MTDTTLTFTHRVRAALIGGAIGDAMGAPVEDESAASILSRFTAWDFAQFIPPQGWDGVSHYWKGNGRITDDTLMIEAFMHAYNRADKHMDSYDYATPSSSFPKSEIRWFGYRNTRKRWRSGSASGPRRSFRCSALSTTTPSRAAPGAATGSTAELPCGTGQR